MLDDEFDYEGNIGKLSKLGESTRLKTSLKKLLELYLEFRKNIGNGKKKGKIAMKRFQAMAQRITAFVLSAGMMASAAAPTVRLRGKSASSSC